MEKPTLLMIHGLAGSLDYFGAEARIKNAQVHTLDLLGYGDYRDVEPQHLTLRGQAEHVASTMAALPKEPLWLLAHSMGGAVVMMAADQRPELVRGIINVEGNFLRRDTFWSSRIIAKPLAHWTEKYRGMQEDIPGCLKHWGIKENAQRGQWLSAILEHQPPATIYAMSKALIEETCDPAFLELVRRVIDRGTPLHLIAGERSAKAWGIPEFVRRAARSYVETPDTGHLMMLEDPEGFCATVDSILESEC
jgi:pimeloyl-ACP methyl ester carboxylesterase